MKITPRFTNDGEKVLLIAGENDHVVGPPLTPYEASVLSTEILNLLLRDNLAKTTRAEKMNDAFKELRSEQIIARQNTDSLNIEAGKIVTYVEAMTTKERVRLRGSVFYVRLRNETKVQGKETAKEPPIRLIFGPVTTKFGTHGIETAALGRIITRILRNHWLKVSWTGRSGDSIIIEG